MNDVSRTLNAFVPHPSVRIAGNAAGPLAGLTFAAKDLFDVAGFVTGGGVPDYMRTHGPADATAPALQQLIDAGASLVDKTITDDLACGLFGENVHYGTPLNPKAPDRVPGGSSSGSAAAVAGGLVDFALGTDTGGSVRVPAAFCGVFGIRPSHGRIPMVGCIPMAPTFDTCGWFARDAELLERVGVALLPNDASPAAGEPLLARDAFAGVDARVRGVLLPLARALLPAREVDVFPRGADHCIETFWTVLSRQLWACRGTWYRRVRPVLAPGLAERFEAAATVTASQFLRAQAAREEISRTLAGLLGGNRIVVMPTTHDIPPLRGEAALPLLEYRRRTASLAAIASLGRLPQVSIPAGELDGIPVGLSLVAASGNDRLLLATTRRVAAALGV